MKEALSLREATAADGRLLREWRNDDATRVWFFDPEPVSRAEHERWLAAKLADPAAKLLIIRDERQRDIGQVRLEPDGEKGADISISIAAAARDRGYGAAALRLACRYAAEVMGIETVTARIKADNQASIRAFAKAGFADNGTRPFKRQEAVEMIWRKP